LAVSYGSARWLAVAYATRRVIRSLIEAETANPPPDVSMSICGSPAVWLRPRWRHQIRAAWRLWRCRATSRSSLRRSFGLAVIGPSAGRSGGVSAVARWSCRFGTQRAGPDRTVWRTSQRLSRRLPSRSLPAVPVEV